ncbi:hypothetical protein HY030_01310 [Candidatus Gottesmanbacteria bacterium]|nr:hypothetical protein [Candidatus Gottesmanbacteria bacterium]
MKIISFFSALFLIALSSGLTYLFFTKTSASSPLPSLYQKIAEYQTKYQPLLINTVYYLKFQGMVKSLSGASFTIEKDATSISFSSDPKTKAPIIFQEKKASGEFVGPIYAKDVHVGDLVEVSARLDKDNGNLIPDIVARIVP